MSLRSFLRGVVALVRKRQPVYVSSNVAEQYRARTGFDWPDPPPAQPRPPTPGEMAGKATR